MMESGGFLATSSSEPQTYADLDSQDLTALADGDSVSPCLPRRTALRFKGGIADASNSGLRRFLELGHHP
jgi:hypothetical protein